MQYEVRPFRDQDAQAALDLRVAAFSGAMHVDVGEVPADDYVPDDHRLVAVDGDRVVGHLGVWPIGQMFGGRAVPMGGVGGVAVAIDQRRRGIGSALLAAGLDLMGERGLVMSTMYPSIPLPYRRWGWEVAGEHMRRRVALRDLLALPRPDVDVDLRPCTDDDIPALVDVHNAAIASEPGGLVATERWIRRAFAHDPDEPEIGVVALLEGVVAGASLAAKTSTNVPHMSYELDVLRLFARDRDVELALWHNLASHHSVAVHATIRSRPDEPLLFALPWSLPPVSSSHTWMSRIIDLGAAMAARGWPPIGAELHLDVVDPRRPANHGPCVLTVHGGDATVEPGGDGRVVIDVGALSSLFTGFTTPTALARAGRLRADDPDRELLGHLFATSTPFLRDSF